MTVDESMPELIGEVTNALFLRAREMAQGAKGIRCEDFIAAAAAFAGEVCMRKAADFDFDNHAFTPGERIFSQKVNVVLSGDVTEWKDVPVTSAFGALHNLLTRSREIAWPPETFPGIAAIYENFAKGRGHGVAPVQWGYVPLSLSPSHFPQMPPLRSAFELRKVALGIIGKKPIPVDLLLAASSISLIKALTVTRSAIDNAVAIRLAMETMNGIAKTAPVLPKHMQEFAAKANAGS
jgi:hypothetical protein